jgi:two-component system LytT family response regulator
MSAERRVLIVDDETLARQRVARFLAEAPGSFIIDTACNGLEALEKIALGRPEIVFLDVQMPELDGFDVLAQAEPREFQCIFVTAYDEFAIRAFEANACDYLLKPFRRPRFFAALERATERLETQACLARLEHTLSAEARYLETLAVRSGNKLTLVRVADVVCFVSHDHYTFGYTHGEDFICDLSLSRLEERLDPRVFERVHRKSIVNRSQIRSVSLGEHVEVELANGMRVSVSRSKRQQLLAAVSERS